MSYKLRRMYRCDLCNTKELSKIYFGTEQLPSYDWYGSEAKDGFCLCPDCARIFKGLKLQQYTDTKEQ